MGLVDAAPWPHLHSENPHHPFPAFFQQYLWWSHLLLFDHTLVCFPGWLQSDFVKHISGQGPCFVRKWQGLPISYKVPISLVLFSRVAMCGFVWDRLGLSTCLLSSLSLSYILALISLFGGMVLGIEIMVFRMLGEYFTTELHLSHFFFFFLRKALTKARLNMNPMLALNLLFSYLSFDL